MILHLFNDQKVVNRSIELFEEALPGQNIFVVFAVYGDLKYVHEAENVLIYKEGQRYDRGLFDNVNCVLVHYLTPQKINFIHDNEISAQRIYWMIWGADVYNAIISKMGYQIYYEPRYAINNRSFCRRLINKVLDLFHIDNNSINQERKFIKEEVTHLLTSYEEYDIQKKYLKEFRCKEVISDMFTLYYSIDDILGSSLLDAYVSGDDIWVGGSCSVTNNHNYVFKYLSKLNVGSKRIITPLSYGGNNKYKEHIIHCGKELFADNFSPILNFMPLDDYNKLLLQASICIFGNWRQEAVGSVLVALYIGAKVFLSKKSPLFMQYQKLGLFVYSLEDICQADIDTPLSDEQKENNKRLLFDNMSRNTIINGIRRIWG